MKIKSIILSSIVLLTACCMLDAMDAAGAGKPAVSEAVDLRTVFTGDEYVFEDEKSFFIYSRLSPNEGFLISRLAEGKQDVYNSLCGVNDLEKREALRVWRSFLDAAPRDVELLGIVCVLFNAELSYILCFKRSGEAFVRNILVIHPMKVQNARVLWRASSGDFFLKAYFSADGEMLGFYRIAASVDQGVCCDWAW